MSDEIADQIFKDVQALDERLHTGSSVRNKVITKLADAFDRMNIDAATDNPKVLEAKMCLVNTLLKTVSDEESQRINVIKLKQSIKKDKESVDAIASIGAIVTEYLKNVNPNNPIAASNGETVSDTQVDEKIQEHNFEILEGELEMAEK